MLDPAELGDGFLDGVELLDEGEHLVLGIVERLRLLEHFGGARLGRYHDAVLVADDDVARIHTNAGAGDRSIRPGEAKMVDRRRRYDSSAEDREVQLAELRG